MEEPLSHGELSNNGENNKKRSRDAKRRRRRRKQKKNNNKTSAGDAESEAAAADEYKYNNSKINESVEVEYIAEKVDVEETFFEEFRSVLEKFNFSNSETAAEDDVQQKEKGVSNKKKKIQRRMKIAELIQISSRPDIVEVCDATAADPKLLVFLKSYRNTVPVPSHWCQKRKFLQGRRGIEKQPYQLPDFIAATRIEKMRQAYLEKEDSETLKTVVNYLVLHDAFFRYQTKPNLTTHGDLYHEGKEFEVKLRGMKPGMLSHELKAALGMLDGAPPPWLINMQRYGPPPSYPHLKIPGLNAPISPGASFGYHPGGWGKPPVDEFGSPLYGDVFGVQQKDQPIYEEKPVYRSKHWGDLEEKISRYEEARKEFSDMFAEVDRGVMIEGVIGSKRKSKLAIQRKEKKTRSEDICVEIDKFSWCRAQYINHFPEKMHRYIWSVVDTSNDGHCGFNALARHLGYTQHDGWRQVREELYQELETRLHFYTKILSEEIVARLLTSIPCTEPVTGKDHYMSVPHATFLFANRYMMPIVLLSKTMNYTFFPMCAPPADHKYTTLCAIGLAEKHFVIPVLFDHSPIPPPHKTWYRHKSVEANAWTTPYLDAIWAYKKMKIKNPLDYYDVFTD